MEMTERQGCIGKTWKDMKGRIESFWRAFEALRRELMERLVRAHLDISCKGIAMQGLGGW